MAGGSSPFAPWAKISLVLIFGSPYVVGVTSLGVQISLETRLPCYGVCPTPSWLAGLRCRYGVLLEVVDLHYLVMVVPNYELPSATSLPAPWGGAHFHSYVRWQPLPLSGLPPFGGWPSSSPLTGGGPGWVQGSRALGVDRRGHSPFPS